MAQEVVHWAAAWIKVRLLAYVTCVRFQYRYLGYIGLITMEFWTENQYPDQLHILGFDKMPTSSPIFTTASRLTRGWARLLLLSSLLKERCRISYAYPQFLRTEATTSTKTILVSSTATIPTGEVVCDIYPRQTTTAWGEEQTH